MADVEVEQSSYIKLLQDCHDYGTLAQVSFLRRSRQVRCQNMGCAGVGSFSTRFDEICD